MDLPTGWDVPPQHDCPHYTVGERLMPVVDAVTDVPLWPRKPRLR